MDLCISTSYILASTEYRWAHKIPTSRGMQRSVLRSSTPRDASERTSKMADNLPARVDRGLFRCFAAHPNGSLEVHSRSLEAEDRGPREGACCLISLGCVACFGVLRCHFFLARFGFPPGITPFSH
jgi:hypothetical protein